MIVFVRTANIAPGKNAGTLAFSQEIVAHMRKTYDVQTEVLRPVGGNPQRIAWTSRYKNLAALEELVDKLATDKAYWELVGKNSDCFIAGSMNDVMWKTA